MTTTQPPTDLQVTRPQPAPSAEPAKAETITVTRRSPRPHLAALTLALVTGPATAWLLLYAPLTTTQQLLTAAGVPILLALLAAGSALLDHGGRH